MTRLALRRLGAWVIDWLVIGVYAAALVPLGLVLVDRSVRLPPVGWNALTFVLLIGPATLWLAAWEGSRRAATPGKRALGLRVRSATGGAVSRRRALARNTLKVALPWELGHTTAFVFADPDAAGTRLALGVACAVVACLLAAGYVVTLFVDGGRTPYDRAAGTRVARA